jgi:hypothetical protein
LPAILAQLKIERPTLSLLPLLVIPAKAGIQFLLFSQSNEELDPGFRRDDEQKPK